MLTTVLLLSTAPAAAQDAPPREYWTAIDEAIAESEAGRHAEALVLFRQAHELSPSARTLRGIGLMLYELEDYVEAMTTLAEALRDPRRPLEPAERAQTEAAITRLRALIGRVTLDVEPSDARALVDGTEPTRGEGGELLLDPGRHQIELAAGGFRTTVREVELGPGERITLTVELEPAERDAPDAPAGPTVHLDVRGEGLTLHAVPLLAAQAQRGMMGASASCHAPCELDVPPGDYALGVSRGRVRPLPAGTHDLSEDAALSLELNDREGWRILGFLTIPISLAATVGLSVGAGFVPDTGGTLVLVGAAVGTGILGVVLSLTWSLLRDTASVRSQRSGE